MRSLLFLTALILGDSHAEGHPGQEVRRKLKARGYDVILLGQVGLSAPKLAAWPILFQADLVLIFIGTNDHPGPRATRAYKKLKKQYPQALVVGPPNYPTRPRLQKQTNKTALALQQVFGKRLIDSRSCSGMMERRLDGVHFTLLGAQVWAACIKSKIEQTQ